MGAIVAVSDAPAGERVRPQQRPAPPGRPRPGPRQPRRAVGGTAGRGHRRRVEPARVRGHRPRRSTRRRFARLDWPRPSTVLKGCFGDGPFSFSGEHYTITDYDAHPKPVQQPQPPFLIGGGGRRTLELAAREADIVGLAPRILPNGAPDPRSVTFEGTREKIEWVRAAAGERFDGLELNAYPSMTGVSITDRAAARGAGARGAAERAQRGRRSPARSSSSRRTSSSTASTASSRSSPACAQSSASARSWSATWTSSPRSWSASQEPEVATP